MYFTEQKKHPQGDDTNTISLSNCYGGEGETGHSVAGFEGSSIIYNRGIKHKACGPWKPFICPL